MGRKVESMQREMESMQTQLDHLTIERGLVIIGEAASVMNKSYTNPKRCPNGKTQKRPLPNQDLQLPEVDGNFFDCAEYQTAKSQRLPTQNEFEEFCENASEVKHTYSHEATSLSPEEMNDTYKKMIVAMARSSKTFERDIQNRKEKFRKIGRQVPSFKTYERMKPFFVSRYRRIVS